MGESFMTMTVLLSSIFLFLVLVTPLTQAAPETFTFDDVSAAGCTCSFEIKVDPSNGRIMGTIGSCDSGCSTTIKKLKLEGDGCDFVIAGLKVKKGRLPKKWKIKAECDSEPGTGTGGGPGGPGGPGGAPGNCVCVFGGGDSGSGGGTPLPPTLPPGATTTAGSGNIVEALPADL